MLETSLLVQGYKCFKDKQGFEEIKLVNLIIGRNNSGKSALLDLIDIAAKEKVQFNKTSWRELNKPPELVFTLEIEEKHVKPVFRNKTSGGGIPMDHGAYGQLLIGRSITFKVTPNGLEFIGCGDEDLRPRLANAGCHSNGQQYSDLLCQNIGNPFKGKTFRRILAERDIRPEPDDASPVNIEADGSFTTRTIQRFLNWTTLDSNLVKKNILDALNQIFTQDAHFSDLVCQLDKDKGSWEIYLEEETKGQISLSNSGSGLKTVIIVLANLILIPKVQEKSLNEYIFGFEEIENNIHPSLLRRLSEFIYQYSQTHNFSYFMTTHSNVLIDQFSRREDAQIIHVTQNEGVSTTRTVKTYIDNNGVLDDLDVRASDILQANGIIWVEGPSDRIYLNRWIEIASDGQLKEGTHYQIMFYGGRLLSHLNASNEKEFKKSISILNINRKAAILIDSDKTSKQKPINDTKKRIQEEFDKNAGYCWITKGKEIENYLTVDHINNLDGSNLKKVEQYSSLFDQLDKCKKGLGKREIKRKALLAEKMVAVMDTDNIFPALDLEQRLKELCSEIKKWN
jgi:predicted ATP-dependent endonuclease of OLD family